MPKAPTAADAVDWDASLHVGMTPLEVDLQLQAAEYVFRSVLEGKRPGVDHTTDIERWTREALGDKWVQENKRQREELARRAQEAGENTPLWAEALADAGDVSWELFERGERGGERLKSLEDIDRDAVLGSLQALLPKVRDSHYARCGAGNGLYGLRAMIAVLRVFERDPLVLACAADCVTYMVSDHKPNRDNLAELSLPMPPVERRDGDVERGWAFLRAAVGAFVVQAGASDVVEVEERRDVAAKLAECVAAVRDAPAMKAQLALLSRPAGKDNSCPDRLELKDLLAAAYGRARAMVGEETSEALEHFAQMLERPAAHAAA